jgi:membrane-bound lytic murein transglycosylase D
MKIMNIVTPKKCLLIVVGIFLISGICVAPGYAASDQEMIEDVMKLLLSEISKLSARITYLEQQQKTLSRNLANLIEEQKKGGFSSEQLQQHLAKKYALPKVVSFCNERIPLDKWDVWERLDSEFLSFLVQEKQVFLWLKRGGRYFPIIEEELAKAGLPDDLKYIAIVESGLRADATSHAGAVGFWQFIQSTGDEYGLEQNAWLDNRRNFYASTQAAIKYLKKLYGMFHDWPLALAAYNCGEGRVLNAMKAQGVHNYYQLELPRETERYVFMIIAAKLILSDPGKYGFYIDENNIFPPHRVEQVKIQLKESTHLRDIAKMYGSYYREFRLLNPEIRSTSLPAGTHIIKVPQGWQKLVSASQQRAQNSSVETLSSENLQDGNIVYIVKSGDSLSKIARKFNVSVNAITKLEGKTKSLSMIHPGEKLLILKK